MRREEFMDSLGAGKLHVVRWTPEGEIRGVVQIIHGIAEYVLRYEPFAEFLNASGYLVVAEDHMGHGQSVNGDGIRGYFHGGWFTAAEDSYGLLTRTRAEFPDLPYILFGHSMGSFLARTILCKHPDSGIRAAIICGTGWQHRGLLNTGIGICELVCKKQGEENPSKALENMVFSGYNKKVEHPRTAYDWLTRDSEIVDEYIASPQCGFTPTAGLMRELLKGIRFVQEPSSLSAMKKGLPVLFISGEDDPVGSYGKGVLHAANSFRRAGMQDVSHKLYPLGRHEILNEINREEVYQDVSAWLGAKLGF